MDFNSVCLPKIEASDPQCNAEAEADDRIAKSDNPDDDLACINHQVDDLFTKLEVELNGVEQFYSTVSRNQQQNGSNTTKVKDSSTPSAAKKNQTRAVAAKRRQELKLQQDRGSDCQEGEALLELQLAQEATHARTARKISNELHEVNRYLEELREMVLQKCRKFSVEEKKKLGAAFTKLSPEHLIKALEIVTQTNPNFAGVSEEVDLDMDDLSESTLWKLKIFVKEALKIQESILPTATAAKDDDKNINNKRKKKICDALAKTKRTKTELVD
uniref:NET domain-containing protein n=1 Tax=Kalanchoe fedtschenkoi TaxID=63787 RepID=A0A7N1A4Y0_KALFE